MGTNNRNFKDVVIRDIAFGDPKTSIFLNCSYWAVHWAFWPECGAGKRRLFGMECYAPAYYCVTGDSGGRSLSGIYIYADSPDIKIEEDEESNALTINFKEYRNIGSESAPTFSNLSDSSIKVKYTMDKAGKTGGVSKTIGYIPIIGDVASFVIDTATDYKENKR